MRRRLCPKEALFTPSFIAVCSANLLFFIASFMMVPVLPIYLLDGLHASKSVVGIILSAYMIGALVMGILNNGMSIMGIGADFQKVVKGAILLLAVTYDVYSKQSKSNG
mgnify:CR=1 FL=1